MSSSSLRPVLRRMIAWSTLALAALAHASVAQSNLSTQGFGFAQGELSARAQAAGGSVGEIDPWSPINPAALSAFSSRILFFQAEPEYRTFSAGGATDRTTTSRFPVVFGAIPLGNWVLSLGAATLLDRTATTVIKGVKDTIGTDTLTTSTENRVSGAMNDVRFAAAWSPRSWLRLGLGVHAITGRNLVLVAQTYSDSAFQPFTSSRTITYSGGALSGGAEIVSKQFIVAASGRYGGSVRLSSVDTVLGSARAPDRFGASVAYTGIAGSVLAVRTSRDDWSSLNKLGSAERAVDTWDTSVGADLAGPQVISRNVALRVGARFRTLPFEAANQEVKETSYSAGFGTAFAAGHILTDVGIIRAMRSVPTLDASEHAWTLSVGITVRQ